jgi:hypothetical protein
VDKWVHAVVAATLADAGDDTQGMHRTPVTLMAEGVLARLKIQEQDVKCS